MNQEADLSEQNPENSTKDESPKLDPDPVAHNEPDGTAGSATGQQTAGNSAAADMVATAPVAVTNGHPSADRQSAQDDSTTSHAMDVSSMKNTNVPPSTEDDDSKRFAELQHLASSDPPGVKDVSQVWQGLVASLLRTGFGMPIVAVLATVLMFSTKSAWFLGGTQDGQAVHAVVYGILIAAICWLALTIFYAAAGFATFQKANINVYLDFRRQFWEAVDSLPTSNQTPERDDSVLAQARRGMIRIYTIMSQRSGMQWVIGYGYIDLWRRLHDAQDLLTTARTPIEMVSMGIYNLSSLRGSNIDNADLLLAQTRQAILDIDPTAESYLDQPVARTTVASNKNPPPASQQQAAKPDTSAAAEALAVIRDVHRAIVQYRDSKWAGLVAARARLMRSTAYTGIFTFLLLAAVIIFGATIINVEAATIFYLVGVLFGGLFQRLYNDGTSNIEVEDYGLATAQLVQISLISGLAGIAGVVLAGLLPITTGGGSGTAVLTNLNDIFSFDRFGVGLIVAAVFGVTPGLLLSRLQQQANQLASDIACSQPTNHH
jgi:hypothetical protein